MADDLKARIGDRRVIASVSGGKDSAAMSLYLREQGIDHDRVFLDTGWEHPATYEYLRGPLTEKLGPITEVKGAHDFVSLVRLKGMFPSRVKRFCTEELKVKPMQAYINNLVNAGADILNCVGIRRAESAARSQMKEWEWADGFDCEVWRPLVAWSVSEVAAIHARHGLAMNPLYALGASRVGCWPCIHARKTEIALVADVDPDRIAAIGALERELTEAARVRAGDAPLKYNRTMFNYHGGDNKHIQMWMEQAVEWARSKRGEWQPPGAGEGCMRHGMCETEPDDSARAERAAARSGGG